MYKKSKYLREWHRRWFVLTSTFLYTYKEERNYASPTEKIPLRSIDKIQEHCENSDNFIIQIKQMDGKIFELKIDDVLEMENWLGEIQRCLWILNK